MLSRSGSSCGRECKVNASGCFLWKLIDLKWWLFLSPQMRTDLPSISTTFCLYFKFPSSAFFSLLFNHKKIWFLPLDVKNILFCCRSQDHCGCPDSISEETGWCDDSDCVLLERICTNRTTAVHGKLETQMCKVAATRLWFQCKKQLVGPEWHHDQWDPEHIWLWEIHLR